MRKFKLTESGTFENNRGRFHDRGVQPPAEDQPADREFEQQCQRTGKHHREHAPENMGSRKADAGEVTNIHDWLTEYRKAVKELVAAINGTDAHESHEN